MRKKFTSIALVVALTLAVFAGSGALSPRSAEAASSPIVTAALMIAYVAELSALWALEYAIKISREHTQDRMKDIHNRSLVEMKFDTTMYGHDHRPLSGDAIVNPPGTLSAVINLYGELASAGGVSFGTSAPGEREMRVFASGRSGDVRPSGFPEDFRESGESLRKYAQGVIDGNENDLARMMTYQDYIWRMQEALMYGYKSDGKPDKYRDLPDFPNWFMDLLKKGISPELIGYKYPGYYAWLYGTQWRFGTNEQHTELEKIYGKDVYTTRYVNDFLGRAKPGDDELADLWMAEFDKLKDYHSRLPYKAADPDDFLDFAWEDEDREAALPPEILQGPGYRSMLQASGQITNFKNHIMPNIRIGIARRAEANAKFSLHETQMRADKHRAFERAVGTWAASSGIGTGY